MAAVMLNVLYILDLMDSYVSELRYMRSYLNEGDKEMAEHCCDCANTFSQRLLGASDFTGIPQKCFWDLRRVIRTYAEREVNPDWYFVDDYYKDLFEATGINAEKILLTLVENYEEPESYIDDGDEDCILDPDYHDRDEWDYYWSSRGVQTVDDWR